MKHRSWHVLCTSLVACLMSFATPNLEALLVSAKAAGMALTGVAYPQDAMAAAFNPAGITEVCDRFDVGVHWDHFNGHGTIEGNALPPLNGRFRGTHGNNYFSPDLGIVKSFCWCDMEVAASLIAYNRDFAKTSYHHAFAPIIGTTHLGLEFIRQEISPSIAVKFGECHSVGLSVNFLVQRFKVTGVQSFDNPAVTVAPGKVTDKGHDYSWGVGVTLGYLGQLTDWLSVGVAYTPKTKMSHFHDYEGFLAQRGKLDAPSNVLAGLAFTGIPCATLTFDFQYIFWNDIRALNNEFKDTPAELLANKLGSKTGPGFGWRSQAIYRIGMDYQLTDCLTVRAGYRIGNSPIRASQSLINLLTLETVEQYVTVGASWQLWECGEISAYYAHGFQKGLEGPIPGFLGSGTAHINLDRNVAGISYGQYF